MFISRPYPFHFIHYDYVSMLHISEIVFLFVRRACKHRCNFFPTGCHSMSANPPPSSNPGEERFAQREGKIVMIATRILMAQWNEVEAKSDSTFFVETLWLARPRWKNRALKREACEVDALRQKASWPMIISLTPGLTTASTHKPLVLAWKQWQCIQDSASVMTAV